MQSLVQPRQGVAPQWETSGRKQMGLTEQAPRLLRVVPCARPPQRQFRTIRENIDRKRIEKLAETNPEAVNLNPPKPAAASASSDDGPPVALLAGGAAVLLLIGALLAGQS